MQEDSLPPLGPLPNPKPPVWGNQKENPVKSTECVLQQAGMGGHHTQQLEVLGWTVTELPKQSGVTLESCNCLRDAAVLVGCTEPSFLSRRSRTDWEPL